ncbi:MAG: FAD-dependent oxidoreductase [Patescibacteria group bacterium]
MKLIFQERRKAEGDAYAFIFKPKRKFSWRAGQYLFYTFPNPNPDSRGITRYFTISSAPFEEYIEITTRIFDKPSTFKKSLLKLKSGDEIEASGPDGQFVIENPKRNFVFISGGIGITPFRSILKQADHDGQKLNVKLLYGNRDEDFVFKSELESFRKDNPSLKIEYVISPNHIDNLTIEQFSNSSIFYISGPAPFVRTLRDIAQSQGVAKENIKLDSFPGY